jgi:hypothetical protein
MPLNDLLKIMERFTAYSLTMAFVGGLIHMAMNSIGVPAWYWGVFGSVATWAGVPIVFNGAKTIAKALTRRPE